MDRVDPGPSTVPAAKGHLEPHFSNLPRRPRRILPTPSPDSDSDSESGGPPSTVSSASSEFAESIRDRVPSLEPASIDSYSSSSQSSSPLPRPYIPHPSIQIQHGHFSKGHVQPSASNVPRRPRAVQVLPGSGIYSLPPLLDSDDSGIPTLEFRSTGESRADIMARALFLLCTSEEEWHQHLVEDMYMRLHDLGMVPSPWMGALRREGLFVVREELKKTRLEHNLCECESSPETEEWTIGCIE